MATKFVCLFGSQLLKLDNCRDEDWCEYADVAQTAEVSSNSPRSIQATKDFLENFKRGAVPAGDNYSTLMVYQFSDYWHKEEYPFAGFNIFEHQKEWIRHLKGFMNDENIERNALKKEKLQKEFYHIVYQYYMIKEQQFDISKEGRLLVQKIHDLEMPSLFFYELKKQINQLGGV